MAHKTLVEGTAYEISGGIVKVDGTGYKLSAGKTMFNGTGFNIYFAGDPIGWLLNTVIRVPSSAIALRFVSNERVFVNIQKSSTNLLYMEKNGTQVTPVIVYRGLKGWTNDAYRTIKFVGDPSSTALTWLAANGKPIY